MHVAGEAERDERQDTHACSSTPDYPLPREIKRYASAKWPDSIDKRLLGGSPEALPTDILFQREKWDRSNIFDALIYVCVWLINHSSIARAI